MTKISRRLLTCLAMTSLAVSACSGAEFSAGNEDGGSTSTGGAAGSGAGSGAAGGGGSGGTPVGGAAGAVGGGAGSGAAGSGAAGGAAGSGAGGVAGSSGSAGAAGSGGTTTVPTCGPTGGDAPKLYTTLDSAPAILEPSAGTGPGAANGDFVTGLCGKALAVAVPGHYISYPALFNVSTDEGTLDLWMLPAHDPKDDQPHQILFVPGRLSIMKDDLGALAVGITDQDSVAQTTLVPKQHVPYTSGVWVRLTVTWDFSTGGQNVHVYFDQTEAAGYSTASSGQHAMATIGSGEPVVIGARSSSGPETIAAVLDDVKIYDHVQKPGS